MSYFQQFWKQISPKSLIAGILVGGGLMATGIYVYQEQFRDADIEVVNDFGGNVFPSVLLATATTNSSVIKAADSTSLGNVQTGIAIRLTAPVEHSKVRIELSETPYFAHSISEFILPKKGETYTIYPDMVWNYQVLQDHTQAQPVSVVVHTAINGKEQSPIVATFSVRSVNECLLGFIDSKMKYQDTSPLFAAYVNEDSPQIDQLLREALDSKIVNRFWGYQSKDPSMVDRQVYALWYVLQKRNFRYSSISNTSLSSNVVMAQRIRTFTEALSSSQINCVDGSALFASLLKAININPVLVRLPGHMFVGYYTDKSHTDIQFLETTMIGDVDLNDFFPEEQLDSTMVGMTQKQASRLLFDKSKEYATRVYQENDSLLHSNTPNYMFLEIDKKTRAMIQPIGK